MVTRIARGSAEPEVLEEVVRGINVRVARETPGRLCGRSEDPSRRAARARREHKVPYWYPCLGLPRRSQHSVCPKERGRATKGVRRAARPNQRVAGGRIHSRRG